MAALDAWTALPLTAAAAAWLLIGWRARSLMFQAALDGPLFARELQRRLAAGRTEEARRLAQGLCPAWAAKLTLRALAHADNPRELQFALAESRAEFELAAQRGLLALRALGRLALPLSLAIAIVELGRGFDPGAEPSAANAASRALSRGSFAVCTGMAAAIACQMSCGLLVRAARQRLEEVRKACEVFTRDG